MFEQALVCTDLSDGLHRLVHCVPNLACSGLKNVIFLHSVPVWGQSTRALLDEEKINVAKQKLAPALENIPDGMTVSVEVSSRPPVDAVREILKTHAIDVIIMGSALRTSLEKKLFGSISLEVARATDIPILLFRPQLLCTYTRDELALRCQHLWKHLLIPQDGSDNARYLVEQIEKYAVKRSPGSFEECMLVRVITDPVRDPVVMECRLKDAGEDLAKIQGQLEKLALRVSIEVRSGDPRLGILEAASEDDISAIAIATTHRQNFLEWLATRDITDEILHQLWFPLLFFSPKQ
jgi:nucleotide-binding universal stress UspA family protein